MHFSTELAILSEKKAQSRYAYAIMHRRTICLSLVGYIKRSLNQKRLVSTGQWSHQRPSNFIIIFKYNQYNGQFVTSRSPSRA